MPPGDWFCDKCQNERKAAVVTEPSPKKRPIFRDEEIDEEESEEEEDGSNEENDDTEAIEEEEEERDDDDEMFVKHTKCSCRLLTNNVVLQNFRQDRSV